MIRLSNLVLIGKLAISHHGLYLGVAFYSESRKSFAGKFVVNLVDERPVLRRSHLNRIYFVYHGFKRAYFGEGWLLLGVATRLAESFVRSEPFRVLRRSSPAG
jgi:hypothetical protein